MTDEEAVDRAFDAVRESPALDAGEIQIEDEGERAKYGIPPVVEHVEDGAWVTLRVFVRA